MRIVILHSTNDEEYKLNLEKHLAPLNINIWDTTKILPGTQVDDELELQLTSCDVVLALISVDFISNEKLITKIRDIHFAKQTSIIPILIRHCLWKDTDIGGITPLPKSGIPIIQNNNEDEKRFFEVAKEIRNLIVGTEYNEESTHAIPKDIKPPIIPYPGITWFERKDALIFFGRNKEVKELVEIITDADSNILLLHGKSGVGKSSLLNAGLLPRLEGEFQISYYRRSDELDSVFALKDIESKISKGKRQLIIIDQLEEIYTNPRVNLPDEKERLVNFLEELSNQHEDVSVILGFRKEYFAEFKRLLETNNIYYLDYYLEPLSRSGVFEAITGIAKNKKLYRKYKLDINDDVVYALARDILKDSESNYAPFLQIILRKMWDDIKDNHPKTFDIELYGEFRNDSFSNLIETQINELSNKFPEEVKYGLILDILDFYTSSQLVAASKSDKELHINYGHINNISQIKNELINLFLLSDNKDKSVTRLAHDSLAPLVNKKYVNSQATGQQASRYLNFALNSNESLSKEGMIAASTGTYFRRIFTNEENKLIENAKERFYRPVIREYIGKGEFRQALTLLYNNFSKTNSFENYMTLAMLVGKYHITEEFRLLDLIKGELAILEKNRFKNSLYGFVDETKDFVEEEKTNFFRYIGKNNLKNVILVLRKVASDSNDYEQIRSLDLINSRLLDYQNEYSKASNEYSRVEFNKIFYAVVDVGKKYFVIKDEEEEEEITISFALIPKWFDKIILLFEKGEFQLVFRIILKIYILSDFPDKNEMVNKMKELILRGEYNEDRYFKDLIKSDEFFMNLMKIQNESILVIRNALMLENSQLLFDEALLKRNKSIKINNLNFTDDNHTINLLFKQRKKKESNEDFMNEVLFLELRHKNFKSRLYNALFHNISDEDIEFSKIGLQLIKKKYDAILINNYEKLIDADNIEVKNVVLGFLERGNVRELLQFLLADCQHNNSNTQRKNELNNSIIQMIEKWNKLNKDNNLRIISNEDYLNRYSNLIDEVLFFCFTYFTSRVGAEYIFSDTYIPNNIHNNNYLNRSELLTEIDNLIQNEMLEKAIVKLKDFLIESSYFHIIKFVILIELKFYNLKHRQETEVIELTHYEYLMNKLLNSLMLLSKKVLSEELKFD